MRRPLRFSCFTWMSLLLLGACVTINVYFPAAAAEKAADKIIDEVWQLKQGQPPANKPAPK
jgi:hypothetical protein